MLGRESLPMWPIREWRLREVKGLAQGHIKLKLEPRPLVSQQKSAHCITLPCGSGWATFLVHYDTPSPLTYQAVFQPCVLSKGTLNPEPRSLFEFQFVH